MEYSRAFGLVITSGMACLSLAFAVDRALATDEQAALRKAMQTVVDDLAKTQNVPTVMLYRDKDGSDKKTVSKITYSNFSIDPAGCNISFHVSIENNGRIARNDDSTLHFREVYTFDIADDQLQVQAALPKDSAIRFVPRTFHLRLLTLSGPFNYTFVDPVAAGRLWTEFAVVYRMCVA
jgi:hypothetical protein